MFTTTFVVTLNCSDIHYMAVTWPSLHDPHYMVVSVTTKVVDVTTLKIVSIEAEISGGYTITNHAMTLIDTYKFSFFPSTIKLWNQLPANIINSSTPNEFCNNLSNFYSAL